MSLYESYAEEIAEAIASGVLRPGERLPSVREAQARRKISPATVFKAYYLLEARGLIRAAPRAGFFVNARSPRREMSEPAASDPSSGRRSVDANNLVYAILHSLKLRSAVPLGSAFPDPALFPLDDLRQALGRSLRRFDPWSTLDDMPPGNEGLRRQILKRYLAQGTAVSREEIVLTQGAMPALNLCLEAVTRHGDSVVVESPCFYVALQALQRLGLNAIEVATDAREGADLGRLAELLKRKRTAACWLMPTFQNPLGASMPTEKKRELVRLLAQHDIPLIEDDVYGELFHGREAPVPAKHFDQRGLVLHCSSFSKCLAPGYRVGWAAAGRFAGEVERLKLMTLLSGSVPTQAAVSAYLHDAPYDAHLRRLRRALASQMASVLEAVHGSFPPGTKVSRPQGGYFTWVELPGEVDALQLFETAFADHVSLAPGPMFSVRRQFANCIRLNTGQLWTPAVENAVGLLGRRAARAACRGS